MNDQQIKQLHRAEQAKRIIEDATVREALDHIKTAIRDQVFALPVECSDQVKYLMMMDKARQQFERWFEIAISGGEVVKMELAMEQNAQAKLDAIREKARNYAG